MGAHVRGELVLARERLAAQLALVRRLGRVLRLLLQRHGTHIIPDACLHRTGIAVRIAFRIQTPNKLQLRHEGRVRKHFCCPEGGVQKCLWTKAMPPKGQQKCLRTKALDLFPRACNWFLLFVKLLGSTNTFGVRKHFYRLAHSQSTSSICGAKLRK